jgi:hypothetical protein
MIIQTQQFIPWYNIVSTSDIHQNIRSQTVNPKPKSTLILRPIVLRQLMEDICDIRDNCPEISLPSEVIDLISEFCIMTTLESLVQLMKSIQSTSRVNVCVTHDNECFNE